MMGSYVAVGGNVGGEGDIMKARALAVALASLAVTVVVAGGASAGDTPCNGPIAGGTINGNVKAGPGCELDHVVVNGEVKVIPGGSLLTIGSTITKNVSSKDATDIFVYRTSVGGNVHLDGTTGGRAGVSNSSVDGNLDIAKSSGTDVLVVRVRIGGDVHVHDNTMVSGGDSNTINIAVNPDIAGNVEVKHNSLANAANNQILIDRNGHIGGNVDVSDNTLAGSFADTNLYTTRNTVDGNVHVDHNSVTGAHPTFDVGGNTITKELACDHNSPPPSDFSGPNTAAKKKGQCANL
jgi:hypothetical protein